LLDIGLPGVNGFEVACRLRGRSEFPNLVIVGISGYGGESYRLRALAAGFDRYLLKPVEPAELCELLALVTFQAESVSPGGANHFTEAISWQNARHPARVVNA